MVKAHVPQPVRARLGIGESKPYERECRPAYALGMEPCTPVELARLLGYRDEARPGLVVRNYLRATYSDHVKYSRWELTEMEAADVLANVPRPDVRPAV